MIGFCQREIYPVTTSRKSHRCKCCVRQGITNSAHSMAQTVKDSFLDLERHRRLLEENVEKLRTSLRHWQLWEAEYEGLKEEILNKHSPSQAELKAICDDYEGDLVTKKEVAELLGVDRTPVQVINLLDRRLDYVEQNVRTVQKQVDAAETKLATTTIVSDPLVMNEEGLPISEIFEQLDENDNVISGRVSTPGSAKAQLLEVLDKVGVKLDDDKSQKNSELHPTTKSAASASAPKLSSNTDQPHPKPKAKPKASPKKAVAFTDDTKSGPGKAADSKSYVAKRLESIIAKAEADAVPPTEAPIIPENESQEDAALRRQMLQYGMSEVGAVVAELDLEDGEGSDWNEEEDDWEGDETDDEDQWGRSTGRLVDDELRERMLELEKKLGVRSMQNVGKAPDPDDFDVVQEGIGRIKINRDQEEPVKSNLRTTEDDKNYEEKSSKKSVKFSEKLDIAPVSQATPASQAPLDVTRTPRQTAPVSDIIERTPVSETAISTSPQPPRKQSRFKSSRNTTVKTSDASPTQSEHEVVAPRVANGPLAHPSASNLTLVPARPTKPKPFSQPIAFQPSRTDNPRTVPTGPENAILSTQVVERDTPSYGEVREPDEFDPQLLNQEVAMEYHKMRNRFIGKAGGFMKEEENEVIPLDEDEGGPRKMSRFKAARLGL